MNRKDFVRSYLSFSRRERIAALVITALILAVTFLPDWLPGPAKPANTASRDSAWLTEAGKLLHPDSLEAPAAHPPSLSRPEKPPRQTGRSFDPPTDPVDPNTLDEPGWQRLGLTARTARIIVNYLSKGGRFRKPGDLRKIYSLQPAECDRLLPYLRFPEITAAGEQRKWDKKEQTPPKPIRPAILELNSTDSASLVSLPGIGPTLAGRILRFREKLGGFYSADQLHEVFGLSDSTFDLIKPSLQVSVNLIRKIRLNQASLEELAQHPYLRYKLARPVIDYRREHGPFSSVEDLRKIMALTETDIRKLTPYLQTD